MTEIVDAEGVEIGFGEVEFEPTFKSHDPVFYFRFGHGIDGNFFITGLIGNHFLALRNTLIRLSGHRRIQEQKVPAFLLISKDSLIIAQKR